MAAGAADAAKQRAAAATFTTFKERFATKLKQLTSYNFKEKLRQTQIDIICAPRSQNVAVSRLQRNSSLATTKERLR